MMTYLLTKWRMTTTVKTCFKCKVEKAITEFYVHPAMGDGRLNKCKECTRKDVAENYRANFGHYQQYEKQRRDLPHRVQGRRAYAQSSDGKASHAKSLKRQRELHPEKYRARVAVGNAIRDGKLVRRPCEKCGAEKSEAHHDDYRKPLEVRWLCKRHHVEHHAKQEAA